MGYYTRILGVNDPNIQIDELVSSLSKNNLQAKFGFDSRESPGDWTILSASNSKGNDLMQIERNPVVEGTLGKEELDEFREHIQECKPDSAVKWLNGFFDNVKVIYAFQMLNASFDNPNFPIVQTIKEAIWKKTGGIFQADDEGFSNEDGYHILWQFQDKVDGEWDMAIRNFWGKWINFRMDLGNHDQRKEFWAGKVPKKATRL